MPSTLRTREGTDNSQSFWGEKSGFNAEWPLSLPVGREWHSEGIVNLQSLKILPCTLARILILAYLTPVSI